MTRANDKPSSRAPAHERSPSTSRPPSADEQERLLDEALTETFPASDPISPAHPPPTPDSNPRR